MRECGCPKSSSGPRHQDCRVLRWEKTGGTASASFLIDDGAARAVKEQHGQGRGAELATSRRVGIGDTLSGFSSSQVRGSHACRLHANDHMCHGHGHAQTGEAPLSLPTPPKRKRNKPARPGDDSDDGAANGVLKKRKANGDRTKPRKACHDSFTAGPLLRRLSVRLFRCNW